MDGPLRVQRQVAAPALCEAAATHSAGGRCHIGGTPRRPPSPQRGTARRGAVSKDRTAATPRYRQPTTTGLGNTPAPARSGGGRGAAAGAGVAGAAAHGSGKRGRGSRRRWQEKSRHSSPRQRRRERKGCRRWRWWRSAVAEGEGSRPLVAAPAARAGRRPAPVTRCGGPPGIVITWEATGRASGRVE